MRPPYKGISSGKPNPVILGRKFCPGCGRWRPAHDFGAHAKAPCGLRSWCSTCQRVLNREIAARRTPEQVARRAEYHLIWQEGRRRRLGIEARQFRNRASVIDQVEFVFLPTAPLLAAIERLIPFDEYRLLCARAEVPERSLFRWRTGESQWVRLDVADRMAIALGSSLAEVWGDTPTYKFPQPPSKRRAA